MNGNGDRRISRRAFLGIGGMGAAALAIGARGASAAEAGYGRLYPDPGGVVEYLLYEDEGHGLAKLGNRLDAYPRIAAFLDEHLGARVE